MADASELYSKGVSALDAGNFNEAGDFFKQSLRASIHFKTLERLGEIAMHTGELCEAITYFAAAVGIGYRQTKARYLLASALLKLDSKDWTAEARRLLREAIDINPDYKPAKELLERLPAEQQTD